MISIDGLAVEFGGTTLFSDISFVINEKDRIALMGKNGAGNLFPLLLCSSSGDKTPRSGNGFCAVLFSPPAGLPPACRRNQRCGLCFALSFLLRLCALFRYSAYCGVL